MPASQMGDARPNPQTGYRQVLTKVGRNQTNWVDTAEPKREDLPHGGILHNGYRKHIDEFKGDLGKVKEAQGERQTPEGRGALAALRGGLDPESAQNRAKAATKASSGTTPRATSRGSVEPAAPSRVQATDGRGLHVIVASAINTVKRHLEGVGRATAVNNGWGHVYDSAAVHLTAAMKHIDRAGQLRQERAGLKSLPHLANAALYLHHANSALQETGKGAPIDPKETADLARQTQAHATQSGRGNDI